VLVLSQRSAEINFSCCKVLTLSSSLHESKSIPALLFLCALESRTLLHRAVHGLTWSLTFTWPDGWFPRQRNVDYNIHLNLPEAAITSDFQSSNECPSPLLYLSSYIAMSQCCPFYSATASSEESLAGLRLARGLSRSMLATTYVVLKMTANGSISLSTTLSPVSYKSVQLEANHDRDRLRCAFVLLPPSKEVFGF